MSHILEATYDNGVLKLDSLLPLKDQEKVRVTVESLTAGRHSLLDVPPVSLGGLLAPATIDDDLLGDDLLGEMLEGRV